MYIIIILIMIIIIIIIIIMIIIISTIDSFSCKLTNIQMNMAASHFGCVNNIFAQNEVNRVFMCLNTLYFIIWSFYFPIAHVLLC